VVAQFRGLAPVQSDDFCAIRFAFSAILQSSAGSSSAGIDFRGLVFPTGRLPFLTLASSATAHSAGVVCGPPPVSRWALVAFASTWERRRDTGIRRHRTGRVMLEDPVAHASLLAILHIRNVPDDLNGRLKEIAARKRRSVNAEVLTMLTAAIEAESEESTTGELLERARAIRRTLKKKRGIPDSLTLIHEAREERGR